METVYKARWQNGSVGEEFSLFSEKQKAIEQLEFLWDKGFRIYLNITEETKKEL